MRTVDGTLLAQLSVVLPQRFPSMAGRAGVLTAARREPAAEAVARGECERGIVLGGSGNGEAIVANRVKGIRCALCWNTESAQLARSHNNANMISLGARMVSEDDVRQIVNTWLTTPFDGGRHANRVNKIDE